VFWVTRHPPSPEKKKEGRKEGRSYLDSFITHLQDRFLNHRDVFADFKYLFPQEDEQNDLSEEELEESGLNLFRAYSDMAMIHSADKSQEQSPKH